MELKNMKLELQQQIDRWNKTSISEFSQSLEGHKKDTQDKLNAIGIALMEHGDQTKHQIATFQNEQNQQIATFQNEQNQQMALQEHKIKY